MKPVTIIKQQRIPDIMGSLLVCTYDDSDRALHVVITDDAYLEVRDRLGCELERIAQHMVNWAVAEGTGYGEVRLLEDGLRYQGDNGTGRLLPFEAFLQMLDRSNP